MDKKRKFLRYFHSYLLVTLGTLILAFGSVVFLSKSALVAGGVSGIGIIFQHFFNTNIYDIVVAILMVITWVLGLIFLGKSFAVRTLYSSLIYIGFTFLFNRIPFFDSLAKTFAGLDPVTEIINGVETTVVHTTAPVANLILCGIFGGVCVGLGVSITFIGRGSTGGVDVIQLILKKYWHIKESTSSLIVDVLVILVGMATMQMWIEASCGILSSVMTAIIVDLVYVRYQTSYQVDIISDKWEEISKYAQDVLERGATIIHAQGGYKGEERIILRVVFDRMQYDKLRDYIATVDPKAFVTFTRTNAVYGEGFNSNRKKPKNRKKSQK